jgi:hypothetical protein
MDIPETTFPVTDRNSISSNKCPKMATQFNDVAAAKKAVAVAVGGMWRWTADLAAGRITTPEHKFRNFQRDFLI